MTFQNSHILQPWLMSIDNLEIFEKDKLRSLCSAYRFFGFALLRLSRYF